MTTMTELSVITADAALALSESGRLADAEQAIEHALGQIRQSFAVVGAQLREIRDARLYRTTHHETFELYLQKRWGFSRSRAYRLIAAAEVAQIVSPLGDTNERQARELVPLLASEGEAAVVEVVRDLRANGNGRVTAEKLRAAVSERQEADSNGKPKPTAERAEHTRAHSSARTIVRHIDLMTTKLREWSEDVAFTPADMRTIDAAVERLARAADKARGTVDG